MWASSGVLSALCPHTHRHAHTHTHTHRHTLATDELIECITPALQMAKGIKQISLL